MPVLQIYKIKGPSPPPKWGMGPWIKPLAVETKSIIHTGRDESYYSAQDLKFKTGERDQ
jgi:hypothetical protein